MTILWVCGSKRRVRRRVRTERKGQLHTTVVLITGAIGYNKRCATGVRLSPRWKVEGRYGGTSSSSKGWANGFRIGQED